jgi:hypothetical protein
MKVVVLSPDIDAIELHLPAGIPCTLETIREHLNPHLPLTPFNSLFFHDCEQLTRSTIITPNPNDDFVTVSYIDKSKFPEKFFPRADYSFPVDHPLFRTATNDFPDADAPSFIRAGRQRVQPHDLVEDVARHLSGPFPGLIPMPQFDYRDPEPRRSRFRGARIDLTVEELDEEEEQNEEEDVEGILEMRDSFEENLSPELEATVDRLMALGFDRNFVTPILFMCHGDERFATEFLSRARDVVP